MTKHVLVLFGLLLFGLASSVSATEDSSFFDRHQVGLRFGGWSNRGTAQPATAPAGATYLLQSSVGQSSFYAEFHGAHRLFNRGYLGISLGFVNRGEVSIREGTYDYLGNLVLYPILVQLKYYLPMPPDLALKPYVEAGGGLYVGRHSIQFSNDYYASLQERSATSFNYVLGGGIDWPLAESFSVGANARYLPVEFGKDLILVRDYKALTITVGATYLMKRKNKNNHR